MATDNTERKYLDYDGLTSYDEKIKSYYATVDYAGMVKPDGETINVDTGVISVPLALSTKAGIVKPDGTTTSVDENGVISVIGGGGGGGGMFAGNIAYGTTDMVPGVTPLAEGAVYLYYEEVTNQ